MNIQSQSDEIKVKMDVRLSPGTVCQHSGHGLIGWPSEPVCPEQGDLSPGLGS